LAASQVALTEATASHDGAALELKDTKNACTAKKDEYEHRQETRSGEIAAMGQAIEILEKITGVRTMESKGYSFLQVPRRSRTRVRR